MGDSYFMYQCLKLMEFQLFNMLKCIQNMTSTQLKFMHKKHSNPDIKAGHLDSETVTLDSNFTFKANSEVKSGLFYKLLIHQVPCEMTAVLNC